MPAVTADTATLPRLPHLAEGSTAGVRWRPVVKVVTAARQLEGNGFVVRRPFPGVDLALADPFVLLDHMGGPETLAPGEAKGTSWHPHRGFETVTYLLDGQFRHTDSHGGGGVLAGGDTQWMTAGSGILHIEEPTDELLADGGVLQGVQLWVNLPRKAKLLDPRYQDIRGHDAVLLTGDDGAALVRVIAGELAGHRGPGSTYTPITYAHVTLPPGTRLATPWPENFNALVYALAGNGFVGPDRRPLAEGQLAVLGAGDALSLEAAPAQPSYAHGWELLLLGGQPIREPVARYGPFVMNTREELAQAFEDYQAGRMGTVPASSLPHASPSDEPPPER
jgi:redox-sensitive bicupin YhaK (pirin superfamily)